jgi:dTDP-L-rhamnose 4-epimerase
MTNKRILITGGAGFIGRATTAHLVQCGWHVIALDNLDPQIHGTARPIMPEGAELVLGDVRDKVLITALIGEVDAVMHLAARTGVGQSMYALADYVATNTGGTASLLEALIQGAHHVQKLVVASSRAIYGEGAYRCDECGLVSPNLRLREQLDAGLWEVLCPNCSVQVRPVPTAENKILMPGSVYAITKRDQEEMCLCVGQAYGIETIALRYFNVYGAGQSPSNPYTGVIPAFATHVLSGRAAEVYEDGSPLRDFVHVEDVARANVLALNTSHDVAVPLNIGSAEPVSIFQAAATVTCALGGKYAPQMSGRFRVGDVRHCYADIARAQRILGYEPSIMFEEGIRGMVDWLRSQYRGDFSAQAASELAAHGLLGTAVEK